MKCIAIDDEPLALTQLSDYISQVPFLSLVKSCQDAFEAMKILSEEEVDLIFVDINMPDLNGLDFIRSLVNRPLVIFTTAYSEYAVEGFKLDAVDYLLKPFEFQDLLKAADKARRQFEYRLLEQQGEIGNASQIKGDSLFVKSDYRVVRIDVKNIRYIEGMSEYVCGRRGQACNNACQPPENGRTASHAFHAGPPFLYCQSSQDYRSFPSPHYL